MADKKKLGELLKDAGLIDDVQLNAALSHQKNWGGKLGSILVEMQYVHEADLARILAERLRIPYVNLFDPPVPDAITRLIKPEIAKKYTIIPARKDGGSLIVAMADPMDMAALDEVRFITGLPIKPALAMESEIKDAIRKYYDREEVIFRDRAFREKFDKFAAAPADKMEIIREGDQKGDINVGAEWKPPAQAQPAKSTGHETVTDRLLIDALVNILLEKKLITREELLRMIEQKRMGL
jgi:hypothetical protein